MEESQDERQWDRQREGARLCDARSWDSRENFKQSDGSHERLGEGCEDARFGLDVMVNHIADRFFPPSGPVVVVEDDDAVSTLKCMVPAGEI